MQRGTALDKRFRPDKGNIAFAIVDFQHGFLSPMKVYPRRTIIVDLGDSCVSVAHRRGWLGSCVQQWQAIAEGGHSRILPSNF